MASISSSSPAKTILFGEHAVVYGKPAIAVPVNGLRSHAYLLANPLGRCDEIWIEAPNINLNAEIHDISPEDALVKTIFLVKKHLSISHLPSFKLKVVSDIPLASGLGSGASVTISVIRALSTFLGRPLSNEVVNQIAFEIEKIYHGTPSGIDNTVITYAVPIFFRKDYPIEFLNPLQKITLVIADTGIKSPTSSAVSQVNQRYQVNPAHYQTIFEKIGELSQKAYTFIENGEIEKLGSLMSENHAYLQELNVSCSELDILVDAAMKSGALGAKLSGGGLGGNMIALTDEHQYTQVMKALNEAGATRTTVTHILPNHPSEK